MANYGAVQTIDISPYNALVDASGRERISQITTLFDGKIVGGADTLSWDTAGNGVASYESNKMNLSVTADRWAVYQSRRLFPYFSGKSQLVEMTFDHFDTQAGVTKRIGYFSSSEVSPHTANVDGFYIEDDGVTKRFVMKRVGATVFDVPFDQWVGRDKFSTYNWANFTVVLFDFLWLGGAVIRMFIKHPHDGFVLAHVVNYAGTSEDVFMLNPSQPLRYEIRSSGGIGDMRAICSVVGSEGSLNRVGRSESVVSELISANTVGVTYAIAGVRGRWARKHNPVDVSQIGGVVTTVDSGVFLLLLNPTLSAPLTWADRIQYSVGTATTQTVSNVGRILNALPVNGAGASISVTESILPWLAFDINGTPDELILAYRPATTQQSVIGTINLVEY